MKYFFPHANNTHTPLTTSHKSHKNVSKATRQDYVHCRKKQERTGRRRNA
jgi:hypothetical protein